MKTIELRRYDHKISQIDPWHCIPAILTAMIKYHDPAYALDQSQIMNILKNATSKKAPSFEAAELAASLLHPSLSITKKDTSGFTAWLNSIKSEIDQARPIAFSVALIKGFHIRSIIGYSDKNELFLLHDPGLVSLSVGPVLQKYGSGGYTIASGIDTYSFGIAKDNYEKVGGTDLLIIQ